MPGLLIVQCIELLSEVELIEKDLRILNKYFLFKIIGTLISCNNKLRKIFKQAELVDSFKIPPEATLVSCGIKAQQ